MIARWLLLRIPERPGNSCDTGQSSTAVIYFSGDLDEAFRPSLTDCLRQLASKQADRLVLDLSDVNSLDRWSVAAMLDAAHAVLPHGVHPLVRNPPPASRVLALLRQGNRCVLELPDRMPAAAPASSPASAAPPASASLAKVVATS